MQLSFGPSALQGKQTLFRWSDSFEGSPHDDLGVLKGHYENDSGSFRGHYTTNGSLLRLHVFLVEESLKIAVVPEL